MCIAFTLILLARKEDLVNMRNLFLVINVFNLVASKSFAVELRLSDIFASLTAQWH